jgi:Asp-tRNA(Asn)/Glu-tRNA(Gln) amidotransferase A subunit family amidase
MPLSVKDTVNVAGYASSFGYSSPSWLVPFQKDAAIVVRLLRDTGAYPFVKTNVPITLLSSSLNRPPMSGGELLTHTLPSTLPVGLQVAKPHSLRLAAPD